MYNLSVGSHGLFWPIKFSVGHCGPLYPFRLTRNPIWSKLTTHLHPFSAIRFWLPYYVCFYLCVKHICFLFYCYTHQIFFFYTYFGRVFPAVITFNFTNSCFVYVYACFFPPSMPFRKESVLYLSLLWHFIIRNMDTVHVQYVVTLGATCK